MAEIPFPGGAADQDVFFHEDKVCVYHKAINTWECRTVERGIASGQPEAVTTRTVYTIPIPIDGDEKVLPSPRDLPNLRTQYDVNWFLTDQIVRKARPPIISASPPTNHPLYPTAELEESDLWIDPNHIMYYWNGGEWVEVKDSLYYQQDRFDDRYVNTDGDTMTGALELNNAQRLYLNNTKVETRVRKESLKDGNGDPILDNNGDEQWDDNEDRFVTIESLPPHLLKSDGSFGADTSEPFGINFEIDDGNTFRHRLKVSNRNGAIVEVAGGTGPQVTFGKDFPGNQDPQTGDPHWEPGEAGGIKVTNIPTPTKENPDPRLAVNKGYVDTQVDSLQNEIIELEEELEAIIPSLERGVWKMTLGGIISGPGLITFYDDTFGSGNPTGLFNAAKSIWFHETDNNSTPHGFSNVEPGNLLELFVQGSDEFGLYEVVEVHDQTHLANPYWVIDVNFVRTLENNSVADNNDLLRLKTFAAPSGGTASEFVKRSGDKMEGNLEFINNDMNAYDYDPSKNSSHLKFETSNAAGDTTRTVHLYQPGLLNGLACSHALIADGNVTSTGMFQGGDRKGPVFTYYYPKVELAETQGMLHYGSRRCMFWNTNGGALTYGNSSIFGWGENNSTAFKPIKFLDNGLAVEDNHAIHKGYVDEQIAELLAKIEELEMAGGGGTNYRFRMSTGSGSSSTIGSWMQPNTILTAARNPSSNWQNLDAHEVSGGDGYLYVCLPDDTYTLNPTGTIHFNARSSKSHEFFDPNTQTLKLVISNLVKCPDAYNGGKNIWRADIQPDLYRSEYGMNFGGFFGSDDLYVTFAGGSLSKTS